VFLAVFWARRSFYGIGRPVFMPIFLGEFLVVSLTRPSWFLNAQAIRFPVGSDAAERLLAVFLRLFFGGRS